MSDKKATKDAPDALEGDATPGSHGPGIATGREDIGEVEARAPT